MRSSKAFTLVEIMIVVAIIGILIAIAVPGFLKARESSRLRACQENQTKIDSAVQQYILEENFADLEDAFINGFGSDDSITGWGPVLVGPTSYIRYAPICPSGGTYILAPEDGSAGSFVGPVVCLNAAGSAILHPYPGTVS